MRAVAAAATAAALVCKADCFTVTAERPSPSTWKRTQCGGPSGSADIPTKWGLEVRPDVAPWSAYPRPQMVRGGGGGASAETLRDTGDASQWQSLNGLWEWEKTAPGAAPPFGRTLNGSILVPFPVESCLSGVAPQRSADAVTDMWYRLVFYAAGGGPRTLLHFGAVDWRSAVYLNGELIGNHTGGYDGFSFDVTARIKPSANELLVFAHDPSDKGAQPNGKQRVSAIDNPGGDTYTPTSGIWQTVWLEAVPDTYIQGLKIRQASTTSVEVAATVAGGGRVKYTVMDEGKAVGTAVGEAGASMLIGVPSAKLWSPSSPKLYDLVVTAGSDSVLSYFGLRTFTLQKGQPGPIPAYTPGVDRPGHDMEPCGSAGCVLQANATHLDCEAKCNATEGCVTYVWADGNCSGKAGPVCWLKNAVPGTRNMACRSSRVMQRSVLTRPHLNGAYTFFAGFLDQSWWPDGQYTAPSDEALAYDLEATKGFGLNMIRLHQKVNPERWYYHADRLGLVIFQDMIQKYGGASSATVPLFVADLKAMIEGRGNHPCIVQFETFNEGDCWKVFTEKPYDVAGIVALARKLDPTRLVDTDSGGGANDLRIGDVNDIHSYPYPGDPQPSGTQYGMVGEFGGIGAFIKGKEWVPGKCHTYLQAPTAGAEADLYIGMAKTLTSRVDHISASVYTQTTDLELECDGFLNYDRSHKFDANQTAAVAQANRDLIAASQHV